MWQATGRAKPSSETMLARCLLGPGVVGMRGRLSTLDLRTWAALCGLLAAQQPADKRTVRATGYELRERVFGSVHGGTQWDALRASLARLQLVSVTIHVVERDPELSVQTLHEGWVHFIGEVWNATTQLDLATPREWGALKGTSSLRIEMGTWPAAQVLDGRTTWLDLDMLRALGSGLPARLWAALEAWGDWQRDLAGSEECVIGLGEPALQSLGVGGYQQPRQARAALARAGRRIAATDPAYEAVRVVRRVGWQLVARRPASGRERGRLRAQWRRDVLPQMLTVRRQARASLAQAQTERA